MDQPLSGRFQPKEGANFPQATDLGGWSRSPFQSTEHETLILIHARDQLEKSCVCLSPSEAGKNASLVGPGSWLLGYVTATPPEHNAESQAGRGRLRSASLASQFTLGEQTQGGRVCPRSQSWGGEG